MVWSFFTYLFELIFDELIRNENLVQNNIKFSFLAKFQLSKEIMCFEQQIGDRLLYKGNNFFIMNKSL